MNLRLKRGSISESLVQICGNIMFETCRVSYNQFSAHYFCRSVLIHHQKDATAFLTETITILKLKKGSRRIIEFVIKIIIIIIILCCYCINVNFPDYYLVKSYLYIHIVQSKTLSHAQHTETRGNMPVCTMM